MTGLRLQILSSLALLIALLSGLLGLTLHQMATVSVQRSLSGHIDTIQDASAGSMGQLMAVGASGDHMDGMARNWLETGSIDGIWIFDGSGEPVVQFVRDGFRDVQVSPVIPTAARSTGVQATGGPADRSRFLQVPAGRGLGCVVVGTDMGRLTAPLDPVRSLMILYLALHAAMILAFGYFALTLLIVRPVEKLRTAAERIGEGRFDVPIETTSGGREIRELSSALSQTARKLQTQRDALEAKIGELTRAQDEIRTQQDAIIRSEKLASVGRLAAGVAHEIGNPLSVILGFLDLLRTSDLPPEEQAEYLERMQGEAERVNRIIKDLLAYSRSGEETTEPVQLQSVLEGALAVLSPQKIMNGVDVQVQAPEKPLCVRATRDRLSQVVINLVLNAAEAMVGQGQLRITLSSQDGGRRVQVRFHDDGPGIDAELAREIFEPFVTSKPEREGTGLGLAVCQSIVQHLGGTLEGRNHPDGGAVFEMDLPACDPPDREGGDE